MKRATEHLICVYNRVISLLLNESCNTPLQFARIQQYKLVNLSIKKLKDIKLVFTLLLDTIRSVIILC